MNTFYELNNSRKTGKIAISSYVFTQIATTAIEDLMANELKDQISLKYGEKKCKISTEFDKKGTVQVNMEIVAMEGSNPNKSTELIQKRVYEAIYDATELSSIQVNVALVGFASKA